MVDTRVTSVIETYQRRLSSKPYVPSTTFRRVTLGANGFVSRIPVQRPRRRRPLLERCAANSKQYGVL